MWRNAAIYAADHPRVSAAITAVLQQLEVVFGNGADRVLHVRDGVLSVGDASFPTDGDDAAPLVTRLREIGLRGVEFTACCLPTDVAEFLTAAKHHRNKNAEALLTRWPANHARLRLLPLVFDGQFGGAPAAAGRGGGGARDAAAAARSRRAASAAPVIAPHVQQALSLLAGDPVVRGHLQAVERLSTLAAPAAADEDTTTLQLLERIGALLPADVSGNPQAITDVVKQILAKVERDLGELVRRGARVRDGGLLRQALTVARTVFGTKAPTVELSAERPSGRPEDEAIAADVDLLLGELDAIPTGTARQTFAANDLVDARELFGVCLHTLAHGKRHQRGAGVLRWLGELAAAHGRLLAPTFEPYAAAVGERAGALKDAERRAVLLGLLEAGPHTTALARPHLDAQFIAASFPESLPFCVRALGDDDEGRAVLRDGLQLIVPMLQLGGVEAAERSQVFADPAVVACVLALGSAATEPLLPVMARQAGAAGNEHLLRYARTLTLPAAAAAVLRSARDADAVPPTFLARLLTSWPRLRQNDALQLECHELLRGNLRAAIASNDLQSLLTALDEVQHAGDADTEKELQRLARHRRFVPWDRAARAVRRQARASLRAIQESR